MKPLKILYLFLVCYSFGSMNNILVLGDDESRTKEISNSYYKPGTGHGSVVSNVNLFTGQPSYSIPLYNISVRGEVGFPIGLSYSGPVKSIVERTNDISPSGIIGVGWGMNTPFVAINHKGTFTSTDDAIICNLGQFGGGQLLYEPDSGKYFISTNPTIKISVSIDTTGPLDDQIVEWIFTMPNGVRMVFGEKNDTLSNSLRMVRYQGPKVTGAPSSLYFSKPFIYKWDLRRMEDASGKSGLDFEYQKEVDSLLISSYYYERESHLSSIKWKDIYGNEIERVDFTYASLDSSEYFNYPDSSTKSEQRLFETKRLLDVKAYRENELFVHYELIAGKDTTDFGIKRKLDTINIYHGAGKNYKSDGWSFSYDNDFLLDQITKPNLTTDHFKYRDFNGDSLSSWSQDTVTYLMKKANGNVLEAESDWKIKPLCLGQFCYTLAQDPDVNNPKHYLNIYSTFGNYYDSVYSADLVSKDGYLIPQRNYFIFVAPNYADEDWMGGIYAREWKGESFDTLTVSEPTNISNPIQVYAEENYFIIQELLDPRRTWVFLKKPDGTWDDLTDGYATSSCGLTQDLYGVSVWDGTKNHCLEWNSDLIIRTSPHMFIITHKNADVIYAYTLKKDGTGFDQVDSSSWEQDDDKDFLATYPNRLDGTNNYELEEIQISNDYFFVKYSSTVAEFPTKTKYNIYSFNGRETKFIGALPLEIDQKIHAEPQEWDRNAWLHPNYFVIVNQNLSTIQYWKRVIGSNSRIAFHKSTISDPGNLQDGSLIDVNVTLNENFFSLAYHSNGNLGDDFIVPKHTGDYETWLYEITDDSPNLIPDSIYQISATKLYGLIVSPANGLMVGHNGKKAIKYDGNGPIQGSGFILPEGDLGTTSFTPNSSHGALGRVSQSMVFNYFGDSIGIRRSFYNGENFSETPNVKVVERFETRSGVSGITHSKAIKFTYKTTGYNPEYNYSIQSPQFEVTEVEEGRVVTGSFVSHENGKAIYNFYVDKVDSQLTTTGYTKIGRVKEQFVYRENGSELFKQTFFVKPFKNEDVEEDWPDAIQIDRTNAVLSKSVAENLSTKLVNTNHYKYNNKIGAPHFTEQVFNNGTYLISQTTFNSNQLPDTTFSYFSSSNPSLEAADSSKALPQTSTLKLTGASRVEYDSVFIYKTKKTFTLNDVDTTLNDDSLKAGVIPTYTHVGNLRPSTEITIRDEYGQPMEVASYKNNGVVKYATTFYAGRAALPIGTVIGAPYSDCMILNMENGGVSGLSYVDLPPNGLSGRLGSPSQNLSYSTEQAHTGKYSIKIENTTITDALGYELTLKNVDKQKYGYIISAWIYVEWGNPSFLIELYKEGELDPERSYTASPIEGSAVNGRWQRWEKVVPYEELVKDSFFTRPDDYVKVSVYGSQLKIFVDDMSSYPTGSAISISAYNHRRELTSTINDDHLTYHREYSVRGGLSAVRDEKLRVISQSGYNKLGENQ